MHIAVVGGGLFGCTAAIHAARAGHEVHLFERGGALMQAASGINQLRLHEGFHYPRSAGTVLEAQAGLASVRNEYRAAIISGGSQYYAIAKDGSKVDGGAYGGFCRRHGLRYTAVRKDGLPFLNPDAVEQVFSVTEGRIDIHKLRSIVVQRLEGAGVNVHFTQATRSLRDQFDRIIIATYAATNDVANELDAAVEPFQFEVVEKPIVRMPPEFRDVSVVIMDGEFCCVDPYGRTRLHLLGHVKHAIHASNVGFWPEVPRRLAGYLNRGVIVRPEHSQFREMVEAGSEFIPALKHAEHLGSMFTVRAVLPNRDHDDARPTMVQALDAQVIRIFSGKLGCCVTSAAKIVSMLDVEKREAA